MDNTELVGICDGWVTDARAFDRSDVRNDRENAILFYDGSVDFPAEDGRSQAVSQDIADVIEWLIPGLLRVFTASANVAIYEPVGPEDEDMSKQATDGINFIFLNECGGFRVLKDAMHDGLLHGNGVVKHWWAGEPVYETETIRGLTEEEYHALISQGDVDEVLDVKEYMVGPDGQPLKDEDEGQSRDREGAGDYA